jgi:hypothetical protein
MMLNPSNRTAPPTLRDFQWRSLQATSWEGRYDWSGHTKTEVESIWDEVVAKIPAGVTKILEIGSGDGGLYRKIKAAYPSIDYIGIDFVPENVRDAACARGTITCASVVAANTVTVAGVTFTASGTQTAGGGDFDETAGDDIAVASSLVAAINDAGNAVPGVKATNYNGTSAVVTVWATTPGTAGNSTDLASSDGATLAVSGATLEEGLDPSLFQVGGAWESLLDPDADWDFVVSVACVHTYTDDRGVQELFELIDAKATKGYMIVGDRLRATEGRLAEWMPAALATSTNVTESYHEGARAFLDDALLKGLWPYYVHRDGTTAAVPTTIADRWLIFKNGLANRCLAKIHHRATTRLKGLAAPTDFKAAVVDAEGRVTSLASSAITTAFPNGVPERAGT